MDNTLRLKIGEVELDVTGSPELIERERNFFLETVLPLVVEHSETLLPPEPPEEGEFGRGDPGELFEAPEVRYIDGELVYAQRDLLNPAVDLKEYCAGFGKLTLKSTILACAYFDRHRGRGKTFTSLDVQDYYKRMDRPVPFNVYYGLKHLEKEEQIVMVSKPGTRPMTFELTPKGIEAVEIYVPPLPKPKKRHRTTKRKVAPTTETLRDIRRDKARFKDFPAAKKLANNEDRIVLAFKALEDTGFGSEFTINDIGFVIDEIFDHYIAIGTLRAAFYDTAGFFDMREHPADRRAKLRYLNEKGRAEAARILAEIQ